MKRSIEQTLADLRAHLTEWLAGGGRPGVRILAYPPEWEAAMLDRFGAFAAECARAGMPLHVVELGQGFLAEVERRKGLVDQLAALERQRPERALHDLGELGRRFLVRTLAAPLEPPAVARLLVNAGALGPFVSYSSLANALDGASPNGGEGHVAAPTVLAFPGESDSRSLSLMNLHADANYRVPRI